MFHYMMLIRHIMFHYMMQIRHMFRDLSPGIKLAIIPLVQLVWNVISKSHDKSIFLLLKLIIVPYLAPHATLAAKPMTLFGYVGSINMIQHYMASVLDPIPLGFVFSKINGVLIIKACQSMDDLSIVQIILVLMYNVKVIGVID